MFDEIRQIFMHTEHDLLSEKPLERKDRTFVEKTIFTLDLSLKELIIFRLKILSKGYGFLMKDLSIIVFINFAVYTIWLFSNKVNMHVFYDFYPLFLGIVVYFVFFKTPSAFCTANVKDTDIIKVISVLEQYNISKKEYQVLKNLFEKFKENIKKRMLTFKSIIVVIWTIFLYLFDKTALQNFINKPPIVPHNIDLTYMFGYSMMILLLYGIIESYNKGVFYILQSFEFGLIEYEINFLDDKKNE